jgi:hypothetical protein
MHCDVGCRRSCFRVSNRHGAAIRCFCSGPAAAGGLEKFGPRTASVSVHGQYMLILVMLSPVRFRAAQHSLLLSFVIHDQFNVAGSLQVRLPCYIRHRSCDIHCVSSRLWYYPAVCSLNSSTQPSMQGNRRVVTGNQLHHSPACGAASHCNNRGATRHHACRYSPRLVSSQPIVQTGFSSVRA